KARAMPRFAPYRDHGVLEPLEVFCEVIGSWLCGRCGSSGFLHFGVVVGQVNVLLAARKRYLKAPREALGPQFGGLWRPNRITPRWKLRFRSSIQAGLHFRGLGTALERYDKERHGLLIEILVHDDHADTNSYQIGLRRSRQRGH